MDARRRQLILSTLFGTGWAGLRALATGLPISMFLNPHKAAASPTAGCNATSPQYLILLTSGSGDPLNANVPGSYADPGIYHPTDATMTPTPMMVGGQTVTAALPWSTLSAPQLSRTCFFHHATYTNSHGDAAKANRLMGAVMRQEMLVSMIAANTAPCFGSVQAQPVVLMNNLITYAGAVLPILSPPNLQAVLSSPTGPLANLQRIRDSHLDQLNALFKSTGNTAQGKLLDKYANSQMQARSLNEQLLTDLSMVRGTARTDINIASAVLFAMNVAPVTVATYSWGGDNHTDGNLQSEAQNTVASVAAIDDLYTRLTAYNLQNKVTVAFQNVFGRTLSKLSRTNGDMNGRDHNANHHCTVMIGSGFKSSLIGGVTLNTDKTSYRGMGIDSSTGAADDSGDVTFENTYGSVGKTLGAAVGVSQTVLDAQITQGVTIKAALA